MAMVCQTLLKLFLVTTIYICNAGRPSLHEAEAHKRVNKSFGRNATLRDDEGESTESAVDETTESAADESTDSAVYDGDEERTTYKESVNMTTGSDSPEMSSDDISDLDNITGTGYGGKKPDPRYAAENLQAGSVFKGKSYDFTQRAHFLAQSGGGLMAELDGLKKPLMSTDSMAQKTIGMAKTWAKAPEKIEKRFHVVDQVAHETAIYLSGEHVRVKHDVATPTQQTLLRTSPKLPKASAMEQTHTRQRRHYSEEHFVNGTGGESESDISFSDQDEPSSSNAQHMSATAAGDLGQESALMSRDEGASSGHVEEAPRSQH